MLKTILFIVIGVPVVGFILGIVFVIYAIFSQADECDPEKEKLTKSAGHNNTTINDDYDEFVDWGDSKRYNTPDVDVIIEYLDKNGHKTKRDITIQSVLKDKSGGLLIHAFCKMRQANRTFRVAQIVKMYVASTEVTPYDYVSDLVTKSPEYAMESMDIKYPDEIVVLLYLARIDNRMTKKEREIISEYFLLAYKDTVSPDVYESRTYKPSQYKKAIGNINATLPEEKKIILKKALMKIAGAKTDEMKQAAINMLKVESVALNEV